MSKHVAIIGGGFSGTMLAVQLLRAGSARVTLIERGREPGLGLAYGAADPIHLLNVRAGNMSVYPDDPGHFARWLEKQGIEDAAASFAPRTRFGAYVQEQFDAAVATYGHRLTVIRGDAVDLDIDSGGVTVTLDDGATVQADAAVLAFGNLPPPPAGIDPSRLPAYVWVGDPWAGDVAAGLGPDDQVLVIGTGLTMVDIVLLLEKRGFTGPILALSRRGLIPHAHADGAAADKRATAPAILGSALVREVRRRGAAIGWRHAVDELRPFTQALWRDAPANEKGRLLRHLRPWWDIHRHRIAPEVRARIDAMVARGQLSVAAGRIVSADSDGERAVVRWRPRGGETIEETRFARIINCTGPEGDLPRSPEPLLKNLLARGLARPGPGGLGIDIDGDAHVLDPAGAAQPRLLAVGPPTRGNLWEIVAVPDIRTQVRDVALSLS